MHHTTPFIRIASFLLVLGVLLPWQAEGQIPSMRDVKNAAKKTVRDVQSGVSTQQSTATKQEASTPKEPPRVAAGGNVIHVSIASGNNKNDGSKGSPLKNIDKAIKNAAPGDVILVAGGRYSGTLKDRKSVV